MTFMLTLKEATSYTSKEVPNNYSQDRSKMRPTE